MDTLNNDLHAFLPASPTLTGYSLMEGQRIPGTEAAEKKRRNTLGVQ